MNPTNLRWFTVTETREVMEVRADNLDEVAAWCGGKVLRATMDDRPYGVDFDPAGSIGAFAYPGDVLLSDGTGLRVMPRNEFKWASEQWTEET